MSEFRLPNKLHITCSANGRPLSDELVLITIKSARKNNFDLVFGPTDTNGSLLVTREELIKQAMDEKSIAQMDYGDPEYDFAGEIVVAPMTLEDIDRALKAYKFFREFMAYPIAWEKHLKRSKEILLKLPKDATVEVNVEHDGRGIKLIPLTASPENRGKPEAS